MQGQRILDVGLRSNSVKIQYSRIPAIMLVYRVVDFVASTVPIQNNCEKNIAIPV